MSSTNKIDRHDIVEILLKVALHTIKQTNKQISMDSIESHLCTMCNNTQSWSMCKTIWYIYIRLRVCSGRDRIVVRFTIQCLSVIKHICLSFGSILHMNVHWRSNSDCDTNSCFRVILFFNFFRNHNPFKLAYRRILLLWTRLSCFDVQTLLTQKTKDRAIPYTNLTKTGGELRMG